MKNQTNKTQFYGLSLIKMQQKIKLMCAARQSMTWNE